MSLRADLTALRLGVPGTTVDLPDTSHLDLDAEFDRVVLRLIDGLA